MTKLCIVCRVRPAAVPDRNRMGRPVKRVCRECHAERLRGDMQRVMEEHERRKREIRGDR